MARTHNTSKIKQRMADEALRKEEAARTARVMEARTRSDRSRALALAREERSLPESRHSGARDASGAAVTSNDAEEKAIVEQEPVRRPKKRSVSQVYGTDGDVKEEEGDDVSSQGVKDYEERSGADEMAANVDDIEEEDDDDDDDSNTEDVIVPAFQSDHKTWPLFEESLREYMHSTRQVLVVKENINIKRRNDALRAQTRYQGMSDDKIPLVPEEMNPYQRKYICTHGWPERERSKGTRKVHKLRRTDCPFQFLAQVVPTKEGWRYRPCIRFEYMDDIWQLPGLVSREGGAER